MPHYTVVLRPSALIQSFTVRADRWAEVAGSCRFFREDAIVHQVAAGDLVRVEAYDSDKEAQDALLALHRARAGGGATVNIAEATPGKPRAHERSGGVPAEGIRFRVEER